MRKRKFRSGVSWQGSLRVKWHETMTRRKSQSTKPCGEYVKDKFIVETSQNLIAFLPNELSPVPAI